MGESPHKMGLLGYEHKQMLVTPEESELEYYCSNNRSIKYIKLYHTLLSKKRHINQK